jgi:saccharopine dehydrogenase (NAD+, L-lysine-forming)
MGATVLVLGGYGTTGRTLSELLLEHGDADVVLAGRSREKGERAAAELRERFSGRVTARVADAADAASLARAFAGVDLVAVAASVLAHAGAVAEAALDAGADYFDLLLSGEAKLAALERLRPRLEGEGRCFITDGGIHPGLSAAMIRALAPAFGRLERADVGGLLRADWNAYAFHTSTIHEFASELADYRVEALRDGVWTRLPWRDAMRSFDFGAPYGRERCTIMSMQELRRLPEQIPALRECAFYVSGFNPVVDNLFLPLGMVVMKLSPGTLGRSYARLLTWGLRKYGRPPYGTVWQVEAEGEPRKGPAGGAASAGLRLAHPDGYWLTSAAAAACLLQWMDGSLSEPGLHLQALAVEPARMLRDLQRMGAAISGRGVDVGALLGEASATKR